MRLELQSISAAYGQSVVLRDVSLAVPAGSVTALLGPNGAGKTTLLSVASGLLSPIAGRVLLDRDEVTSLSPERRVERGLCHITEGRSVFPGLTVRDNLRVFAPRGGQADAMDRAVTAFPRLGQRMSQLAGTMSGGEQQMLALARAYAQDAPVILLDEVSMGLAPIIVHEIFTFLRQLAASGTSLLIVEQFVAKALDLADYVYLLSRGRIAFAGDPAELRDVDIFAEYMAQGADPLTHRVAAEAP
jgi:branched-chain amino acid transport system ATP-binding protein